MFIKIEIFPPYNLAEEQSILTTEYAYFLEDGDQDINKHNRYNFDFPQK